MIGGKVNWKWKLFKRVGDIDTRVADKPEI